MIDNRVKWNCIKFIESCQNPDGGFGTMPNLHSTMESTRFAVNTLNLLGEEIPNKIQTVEWVTSCQKRDGGFAPEPNSAGDLSSTYYAVRVLTIAGSVAQTETPEVWYTYCGIHCLKLIHF